MNENNINNSILEIKRLELLKKSEKIKSIGFALVALGILSIVANIVGLGRINALLIILGFFSFLFIVSGIIVILLSSKNRKSYSEIVKNELIPFLLQSIYGDSTYSSVSFFDIQDVLDSTLLKKPDNTILEDYISGTYQGIKFISSEITLQVSSVDSSGNSFYETYFSGIWVKYKLKVNYHQILKVKHHSFSKESKLEEIFTSNLKFNKKFQIFVSPGKSIPEIVSIDIFDKLIEFEDKYKSLICFSLIDDTLYFGVNSYHDSFEFSINEKVNDSMIDKVYHELCIYKEIIELFNIEN
ncbi:MAG: DUF3137 domain-containing protein [Acholeplasmatales bacterium]|jgi:hypothetical protein|nr:DUF3137 domain-containing protein [Acholeplasmatales bacterium]